MRRVPLPLLLFQIPAVHKAVGTAAVTALRGETWGAGICRGCPCPVRGSGFGAEVRPWRVWGRPQALLHTVGPGLCQGAGRRSGQQEGAGGLTGPVLGDASPPPSSRLGPALRNGRPPGPGAPLLTKPDPAPLSDPVTPTTAS